MPIGPAPSLPNLSSIGGLNDITKSSALNRSQSLSSLSETDIGHIESSLAATARPKSVGIPARDAVHLLENAKKILDAYNADAMSAMPAEGEQVVLALQEIAELGADRGIERSGDTPVDELAREAAAFLLDRQAAQGGEPLTGRERAIAVMDFAGRIINNDFEGGLGRWAANGVNVGIRTGLIVGLTTTLRQLIGFSIEKAYQLRDAPMPAREVIGAAAMLLGPALNIAGFARDEANHTATPQSRTARVAMLALSVGALIVASQTGEPSTLGSLMSSFGPQMASYTLARDLAQLFLPLNDNAPINLGGALAGGAAYSAVQFGVGEALDSWAPSSGAGRVMGAAAAAARPSASAAATTERMVEWFTSEPGSTSAAHASLSSAESVSDRVRSAISSLQPDLAQDVTRGVLNAAAEIFDDLVRPGISRALHVSQTQAATRQQALAERGDPEAAVAALSREDTDGLRVRVAARVPSSTEVANQFLTTDAMRTSALQTIMGIAMSAATALENTNLSSANQGHVVNAVVAAVVALIYEPFLYAHAQRTPAALPEASPADSPNRDSTREMEVRRRHVAEVAPGIRTGSINGT
ncbi:hypothetical protein [Burkholderia ubonensis]|uniref:hypothetical protein n=1 Tax=Burkholderia ubonensis TaxID=101571 RepID=UPI000A43AF48|nr:hypothetical protein [Burkholderia ubonensis]